jgi:hypothetical protein
LFNEEALGVVFRGKFIDYMAKAYHNGSLTFPEIIAPYEKPEKFQRLKNDLYSKNWVVSVGEPIKQPQYVLEYLGRYTHRVAISNHRIVALKEGMVTFTYTNRETKQIRQMTIEAVEFVRRFLLQLLPKGLVRIRHFGFLSNRNKTRHLAEIRHLLGLSSQIPKALQSSLEEMMLTLTGIDITVCPHCKKGKMKLIAQIPKYSAQDAGEFIRPTPLRKTAA